MDDAFWCIVLITQLQEACGWIAAKHNRIVNLTGEGEHITADDAYQMFVRDVTTEVVPYASL